MSTLAACRNAENPAARDIEEGTKTITSLQGTNYPNAAEFARLLGVNPAGIVVSPGAVKIVGENAVRRSETLEHAFVLCTSIRENDPFMRARFGNGCVRVKDAFTFFTLIDAHLRRRVAPNELGACVVDDVEYGPRRNNYRDHTNKHCAFLKPRGEPTNFEVEEEVRAVWTLKNAFPLAPENLAIAEVVPLLELT